MEVKMNTNNLQMNHDESSQPTIHDSDNSMTEDSDAEEPAWKKTQLADVNINFDRIQVVPSVAITGDELPLEFFTRFIDDDVIQLLVFQTNLYATQSRLKNWHNTNEVEMKAFLGMLVRNGFARSSKNRIVLVN